MSAGSIDEDELHAYVDGALPPEREVEIAAWLAANPGMAARVRQWQAQKAEMHRLFDPVLAEPLPDRLRPGVRPGARARRARLLPAMPAAAAGFALLALGLAGGWWLHGRVAPPAGQVPMAQEAMNAHRVYAVEVRHPVEVAAAEHGHLVGWLSKRLGAPLRTPDLRSAGFDLVGGRLLPAGAGPAAQFMYQDGSGQRLTLYLRDAGPATPTAFRFASEGNAHAFYWTDSGLAYALVGEIGRDRLGAIADLVYRDLAAAPPR